jgi:solute carrier family 45 protein 1/2/4
MTHIANIFGYLAGYLNLGEWSGISWVGGGQFRKLAVISCAVMIVCVSITCYTQEEVAGVQEEGSKGVSWSKAINNVKESIKDLPLPVRRVCYGTSHPPFTRSFTDDSNVVQFFAWTAYFPFLFYSTTYVAEVLFASIPEGTPPPSADTATRAGSLALLLFAIVAFISGSFLPWLSTLGRQPMIVNLSKTSPLGRWTRRALSVLTPRNFWTAGLAMYAVCIFGTFWVESVQGAMVVIAFLGVPWAVNCWVSLSTLPRPSHLTPRRRSHSPS